MSASAKTSRNDSDWQLVIDLVNAHRAELEEMNSHVRLREWAKAHDLDSASRFGKFKFRLGKIGIDYDGLRAEATRRELAEIELAAALGTTPHITLFAAGDVEAGTFAVCDYDGNALWYNTFHENDRHFQGDDVSAETSAAEKAVWLAGQARITAGADAATLSLTVSHHEVDQDVLTAAAVRARVVLHLETAALDNPAIEWCRENGRQSWKEADLSALLEFDDPDDPDEAELLPFGDPNSDVEDRPDAGEVA